MVATFLRLVDLYKIASSPNRSEGTGGMRSGTYNAGTDGGPTGTSRADNVLQSSFHLHTSLMAGTSDP